MDKSSDGYKKFHFNDYSRLCDILEQMKDKIKINKLTGVLFLRSN